MPSHEHEPRYVERDAEIAHSAHERLQELGEKLKHNPEGYSNHEAQEAAETARHEAIKEALFSKEEGKERRTHQAERHNAAQHIITRDDREASFDQTMDEVRRHLPRSTRGFSHLIHHPAVEHISDIVSKTIARPNAILAGSITAFLGVLALYFYAKYAGFALQGSETIITFALGWFIGILFDLFKTMITGKR